VRKKIGYVVAVACIFLLAGAAVLSAQETATKQKDAERVLVKFGNEVITQEYFNVLYNDIPPSAKSKWQGPDGKRKLLTEIITVKLLSAEARRLNLDKDPVAAARIQSAVDQTLAREYQGFLVSQIEVSDAEVKAFWEQHKERFNTPEQARAGHIVVKTEAEAEAVKAELAKGRDFAEVAKEKSFGPEREKGGDLGWFKRRALIKPLDEAVFSLKEEEVSAPVKTDAGYHFLKLYERKPAVEKPYEEVQENVRQVVIVERAYEKMEETKKRLSLEYNVEVVNDPADLPLKEDVLQKIEEEKKAGS
jgi:peptidyl-prolyl cis-trans isomerase C